MERLLVRRNNREPPGFFSRLDRRDDAQGPRIYHGYVVRGPVGRVKVAPTRTQADAPRPRTDRNRGNDVETGGVEDIDVATPAGGYVDAGPAGGDCDAFGPGPGF